jgi:hypothetical protein
VRQLQTCSAISTNNSIETASSVSLSLVYSANTRLGPEMPTVSRVVVQRATRRWRLQAGPDDGAMRIFPRSANCPKLVRRCRDRRRIQNAWEIG